ncbi:hypothetical protein CH330_02415 [candidate division WOR-3 bacterium JGI_Cruoil_03_51_56]|uniref:OmpA-like domain-containing protein n=1 Tax=candidate division WOR-3 bacterium JGI_Cruoil_03_51_56 TaxID=1973747 RepID=A0A235BW23_UNCW3|nr:MAG: hypothetical protein CH330_02415 [candidate division WOR-3 bacterium JGI_Cruoil_03_51_56]
MTIMSEFDDIARAEVCFQADNCLSLTRLVCLTAAGRGIKFCVWIRLLVLILLLGADCAYFNTFYNAQNSYKQGLTLKEQGQAVQAKSKFEKSIEKSAVVISRWPNSRWVDDATFLIGMSYYQMGHYSKAMRHFEQLVLAFPNSGLVPQAQLYRGLALLKDKQYGVARVVLDNVRKDYPGLRDAASFHLAEALFNREDYDCAIDSLSAFVEHFPHSRYVDTAVEDLARASFSLKRWDKAEYWYRKYARVVHEPKERARAKLKVAACLLEQGNYKQAIAQVDDVLGRYRELDDEANLLLGRSLAEVGRDKEALETWAKVRGRSNFGAEAFFRIGKYHEEHNDFALARVYYDTAKSRRANSDYGVLAVKRLALLDAFALGDSSEREPAKAMFLLAEVHNLNLGEYDEAMRLYQAVHDSFPQSKLAPKGLFAKAWILKNVKNDTGIALELAEKIIKEYPETDYADESRRWLGLPVPKRKPRPESVAVKTDTAELAEKPTEPREEHRPGMPTHKPGRVVKPEQEKPDTGRTEPEADTVTYRKQENLELEIVHFDFDKWAIRPDDAEALKRDTALLNEYPFTKLEIVGHCDPRGTEEYNMVLGLKRAEVVMDFLVELGVPKDRMSVRSEGEHRPISTRPEEYWLDRRVEFEITR